MLLTFFLSWYYFAYFYSLQSTLADAFLAELDELEEEDNPIDQPTTTQPISSFDDNEKEMEEEGDSEDADSNEDEKV